MAKQLITAVVLWLLLTFPAYAELASEQVYTEHLEQVTFYADADIDTMAAQVQAICERNQEILGWQYTVDDGAYWTVRYDWRPTTKLLHHFGELSEADRQMEQRAKEILAEVIKPEMSDYQKMFEIYCWIQDNTEYDYDLYNKIIEGKQIDRRDSSQSAWTVFFDGKALCAGYTDAFYYLVNLAGVDCLWVHGDKDGVAHGWNAVQLRDSWYFIDVTDESGGCFLHGTVWAAAHGYSWGDCYLPMEIAAGNYMF